MKSCLSLSEFFSSVAGDAVVFFNSYHSSLDFCEACLELVERLYQDKGEEIKII